MPSLLQSQSLVSLQSQVWPTQQQQHRFVQPYILLWRRRFLDHVRGVAAHVRIAREEGRQQERICLRRIPHRRRRRRHGRAVRQVVTLTLDDAIGTPWNKYWHTYYGMSHHVSDLGWIDLLPTAQVE